MTQTDAICEAVRREIRSCALLEGPALPPTPPPHDLEAERMVLGAVLSESASPLDWPQLRARHFYLPLYGATFLMASALVGDQRKPAVPAILYALTEQGFSPRVGDGLLKLRDETPSLSREHLSSLAARITILWRVRQTMQLFLSLSAHLSTEAISLKQAAERTVNHFKELGC